MPSEKKAGSTASLNQKLNAEQQDSADAAVEEQQDAGLLEHPSYEGLQTKLTEEEDKYNQLWERLLRTQAEMGNLQRRAERDISNAHKYALEKFVLELLPVVDSLERALGAHDEDSGDSALLDGVDITLKMLYAAFEKFEIQQVDPISQPFNPELHQAVSTQVDQDVKPGTVLNVLQKGYLLNNRLIRPALVVVSKNS